MTRRAPETVSNIAVNLRGTHITQCLIDQGWRSGYSTMDPNKPEDCVSIYFGQGGGGPEGTTHMATVYHHGGSYSKDGVSWDIVKLDSWGGIGSRASMAYGEGKTSAEDCLKRIEQIEKRQRSQLVRKSLT